ncbi:unnamed protein product [Angiostrongylus costaricensis]|uniref:ShKT domain-containing protein n=1 Tax=Angiostrongylus costaricensis TaxID=334426 RepID=A0A0R3PZY6_ANGCS|nr:unnamed protein product [Angiostrongylus costaricensis]
MMTNGLDRSSIMDQRERVNKDGRSREPDSNTKLCIRRVRNFAECRPESLKLKLFMRAVNMRLTTDFDAKEKTDVGNCDGEYDCEWNDQTKAIELQLPNCELTCMAGDPLMQNDCRDT